MKQTDEDADAIRLRFEAKIERIPFLTCWVWIGALDEDGYGRFCFKGANRKAHRIAYELYRGPIPCGLELDHLPHCRNRWCVHPWHTEAVTHRENVLRGEGITAQHAKKTHCIYLHELTEQNIYWRGRWRKCRQCRRERGHLHRKKKSYDQVVSIE